MTLRLIILLLVSFTSCILGDLVDEPNESHLWYCNWSGMRQTHSDMGYILGIPEYSDVIIAIVDNGIEYDNPRFANVRWWVNENEILNGIDDDGDGYIDDGLIGGGYDFAQEDNDPMPDLEDSEDHGTNMAGVIVGSYSTHNKQEGLFKNAIIMNLKVGKDNSSVFLNEPDAIRYAVDHGAKVINCSFSDSGSISAVEYAISNNVIVVASVGNTRSYVEDNTHFPSSVDGVIGTGALLNDDELWYASSYGPDVDFMLYGSNVRSVGLQKYLYINPDSDYEHYSSGTSITAALMSGLVGRLLSFNSSYTLDDIYTLLQNYSIPVTHSDTGNGRIDYKSLVESLVDIDQKLVETQINGDSAILNILQFSHSGGYTRHVLRSIYYNDSEYLFNKEI